MNTLLKRAILDYILDNQDEFQITNATTEQFRVYIYDPKGEYLIGGEDVATFISKAIDLIIDNN